MICVSYTFFFGMIFGLIVVSFIWGFLNAWIRDKEKR